MASLTPAYFTVGLSYFTDSPAPCVFAMCLCVCTRKCVCLCCEGALLSSFCCLSLSLSLRLSLLIWVIDMQRCIPGPYRRVCSHGYCGVAWQIKDAGTQILGDLLWSRYNIKPVNVKVNITLTYQMFNSKEHDKRNHFTTCSTTSSLEFVILWFSVHV